MTDDIDDKQFTVTLIVGLADNTTTAMTVKLSNDMPRIDQQVQVLKALDRLIDMHNVSWRKRRRNGQH